MPFKTCLPSLLRLTTGDVPHREVAVDLAVTDRLARLHEKHLELFFGPLEDLIPQKEGVPYSDMSEISAVGGGFAYLLGRSPM